MTDSLTPALLDTLEGLAREATPGPWFVSGVRFRMNAGEWMSVNRYDGSKDENLAIVGYDPRNNAGFADAHLIAACSPSVILALIEAARKGLEP